GNLGFLIKDIGDGWFYVESGDVRGFVQRKNLHTGQRARVDVTLAGGEEAMSTCTQLVAPEENGATYFTLTSIKEGSRTNPVRECIIKSAEQCLGHPYVWGGTSLLNGCDCSGFVQGLYAAYGYTIPRVAENQAEYGRQIPVDNAIPGDLIFFARDGYVYHVALYVGNDQTIEAFGAAHGIIRNRVDHANAVWATRVIQD
ncbi:MAG: C40 family peptidase, partial [Eubacterium sp.]|nr:C40 family peptidase [Eubacterium sp.]